MRNLNTLRWGIRFWLLLYTLSLGLAVAAPMVKPQQFSVVCSSAGILKYVALGEDPQTSGTHAPDCPLCVTATAPSKKFPALFEPTPFCEVRSFGLAAGISGESSAPPLPPRGPPQAH